MFIGGVEGVEMTRRVMIYMLGVWMLGSFTGGVESSRSTRGDALCAALYVGGREG